MKWGAARRPFLFFAGESRFGRGGGFMTVIRVWRPREARSARRLIQAVGFIFYLLAVQALLTAAVGISVFWSGRIASDLVLPGISVVLAAAYSVVGYHLRRHRLWARNFAFAFAGIGSLAFPVGTGVGLLIIGMPRQRQPRPGLPVDAPPRRPGNRRCSASIPSSWSNRRSEGFVGPHRDAQPRVRHLRPGALGLPRRPNARDRAGNRRALALRSSARWGPASRVSSAATSRSGARCASTPARRPST